MFHEREEQKWELESEDIEGIDNEQDDVTPQGSTSIRSQGPPKPERRESPYEEVMLNSNSIGRCY